VKDQAAKIVSLVVKDLLKLAVGSARGHSAKTVGLSAKDRAAAPEKTVKDQVADPVKIAKDQVADPEKTVKDQVADSVKSAKDPLVKIEKDRVADLEKTATHQIQEESAKQSQYYLLGPAKYLHLDWEQEARLQYSQS